MLKPNSVAIRTVRKRKKWTQTDLAEAAGIAMRVVQDTENERVVEEGRRFNRNSMECIAGALEVPIEDIVVPECEPIEPAGWLIRALERAKELCESRNQNFFTAHELWALLLIPRGAAEQCFRQIGQNTLVNDLEARLAEIFPPSDSSRFVDFDWHDRSAYRLAMELARADGRTTDKHYLLAVLTQKPRPKTVEWLRRRVGDQDFDHLVAAAQAYPGGKPPGSSGLQTSITFDQ